MKTIENILNLINSINNYIFGSKRSGYIQYIDVLDNNKYIYYINDVLTQSMDEYEAYCIVSKNKKVLLTTEARSRLERLVTI